MPRWCVGPSERLGGQGGLATWKPLHGRVTMASTTAEGVSGTSLPWCPDLWGFPLREPGTVRSIVTCQFHARRSARSRTYRATAASAVACHSKYEKVCISPHFPGSETVYEVFFLFLSCGGSSCRFPVSVSAGTQQPAYSHQSPNPPLLSPLLSTQYSNKRCAFAGESAYRRWYKRGGWLSADGVAPDV